ncbi:nucleolar GTP-binding protein 1-like [Trifolium pratense]|uniref:Nucleolar GTP-binding protein 1-like n=2 Tax=Trifolium pratense TaxID=57577 RepID=A0A2K3MDE0_TRIPR|nr:nucleolar GTP-binding protein 1-like [Trifolium pratense]
MVETTILQQRVEAESTLHEKIKADDNAIVKTELTPEQSQEQSRQGRKRERSPENEMNIDETDNNTNKMKKQRLSRSLSRFSSRSVRPLHIVVPGEGLRDSAQKIKAMKLAKNAVKKRNKAARRGEADRVIVNLKPKHLYSGKRSKGKNQRR